MGAHLIEDVAVDPTVVMQFRRLEAGSEGLRLLAADGEHGNHVTASRLLQARAQIEGHLLAARAVIASGASIDAVLTLLRRASDILHEVGPDVPQRG